MQATIPLTEDIYKKLQIKSRETGINPETIVNEILTESLDDYNLVRLSDDFQELVDICD